MFGIGAQLSSKDDYGHFFRTIPTELMFGRVMMDFVVSRGWKTIAVFYTGDSLGSKMMDRITHQAARRNIKIGYKRAFWESGASSDVKPALEALQDSGQRIIMVAAVGTPQMRLMVEAVKMGFVSKDYVWLAINQVAEPLLDENSNLMPTDLNGLFMFDNLLKLHGYPPYEQFLDKWAALDPSEYPYAGQRDISSNEPQAYSCMMVLAGGFADAVKGNWTALHLLAAGKLGARLRPMNMNVNYTGPGGPMIFDEDGDVEHGNFILYNFQNGQVVPIGTSYSGVFNLSSPPMYFDGTFTAPEDSAPLHVLNPKFGSPIGMVVISIASLSILFSLLTMLVVVVYRDTQVIKASSPLFCCLELCGFILLYISTVAGLDIPTYFVCIARPLTLNVGFVLVVGNIVAKNFRVYRIFHNIYVTKRVIKDTHLLKIVGTMLLGSLIVMVVWFIRTPPTLQQIIMSDFTTYWTCSNVSAPSTPYFAVLFVYNATLLLVATYLAYKNRNVAANYNECRQIAFVVYNILLSACLAMPTVFLPEEQFLTKFFLSTVVILFGTTFSLMFLFLPKLWELFTQIERAHQRGSGNGDGGGAEGGSDESSMDGLAYNGASTWMNSAGNLAILGQGADFTGAIGGNGASVNTSSHYLPSGRKGSVGTLDESKGDIVKETHMGYMGVKFQNRYLPFLSSWRMRRVVLDPQVRYFTCFELGKPETGKTFTYVSVFIHSRDPGAFILRVIGCGRFDFLLQVRDEERLLHWYNLFDNCKDQDNAACSDGSAVGAVLPLGSLSVSNLSTTSAHLRPISVMDMPIRPRHSFQYEIDQTLQGSKGHLHVSDCNADSDRAHSFTSYYSSIDNAELDNGCNRRQLTSSSNRTLPVPCPISYKNRKSEVDKVGVYGGATCRHGNSSIEGCRICQSLWSNVRIHDQVGYEGGSELRHEHSVVDLSRLPRVEDGGNRIEGEALELSDRQKPFRQAERHGEGVDKDH
ncbi:Metabotropic GABA-B receptor subtype 2, isoform C [Mortierella polycephala]|uniref:Metabotropic GABA-B receptor subtype 2, isoform C n=1 Tax=Mortierella polycephala TaxID=41804 RepID=A0A9P6PQE0_9FUNG|nr:Metabotropic GABA-B receptor subtype 2, isoform C [Mortierella polycephala]